jgi:hypothetical protein
LGRRVGPLEHFQVGRRFVRHLMHDETRRSQQNDGHQNHRKASRDIHVPDLTLDPGVNRMRHDRQGQRPGQGDKERLQHGEGQI